MIPFNRGVSSVHVSIVCLSSDFKHGRVSTLTHPEGVVHLQSDGSTTSTSLTNGPFTQSSPADRNVDGQTPPPPERECKKLFSH